jgi:ankyrin repeat protein
MKYVRAGFDPNALDSQGQSPLDVALKARDIDIFETLLKNGAAQNKADKNENTILHRAVKQKDLENKRKFVKLLLDFQTTEINKQNNQGDTPLHIATKNSNREAIALLLKNNADPTIKNNEGLSPIDVVKPGQHQEKIIAALRLQQRIHLTEALMQEPGVSEDAKKVGQEAIVRYRTQVHKLLGQSQ